MSDAASQATPAAWTASQPRLAEIPLIERQWIWALFPTLPAALLLLRLWLLSHRNLQTMMLLVQQIDPLGLIGALAVTLFWAPPAVILALRALSALLTASDPSTGTSRRSWLAHFSARTPGWVVCLAACAAALTWQLRFLPTLLALLMIIVGLSVRESHPERRLLVSTVCVLLPVAIACSEYAVLAPAIAETTCDAHVADSALLLLPPAIAVILTGPIPRRGARTVTHSAAAVVLALLPLLVAVTFLQTPVLPTMALELVGQSATAANTEVVRGQVVTVDDHMTTLLADNGQVQFILNESVHSKVLCDVSAQVPASSTRIHGWHVERAAVGWLAPRSRAARPDPRCDGRPLDLK